MSGSTAEYQRNKTKEKLAKGICPRCSEPVVPGKKLCLYHTKYAAQQCAKSDPEKRKQWANTTTKRLAEDIFSHYGRECKCCGENRIQFLTMDHIDGNGAEHRRKENIGGKSLKAWLKRHGYPKGFRVLCMNCNHAMGTYGVCPHGTLPPQATNHPANPFKKK